LQNNWKRPINGYGFFLDEKLEWMNRYGIDKAVVLNLSQLYCNGYKKSLAKDVIKFQNDYNAAIQHENPNQIISGFVIQPAYVDDALTEIERCVSQYNMRVLCLPTHFYALNQEWVSVADESCYPIFELANKYHLAIEIHPYDGEEFIKLKDQYWRFHLIWMCALTADTYHMFTLKDFPDKFPNVRTCFAHGNQYSLINIGRRQQGYDGRPDLFPNAISPKSNFSSSNVFIDTIMHDADTLGFAIKKLGVEKILFGLDDPYPLGETDIVNGCYPGKIIQEALSLHIINDQDKALIQEYNVNRWLGKN
jgi:aminocarboxymuconate-semialdehyde decarboxylase